MQLVKAAKNVLTLGIKNSDSTQVKEQIIFLNIGAIVWVFPLLLSAIFFITTEFWHYGILMFMSISFLFLVPILNSFRQFQLSLVLFLLILHFNLIMSNVIAEFHFETYLLIFPIVIHTYFISENTKKLMLHYCAIFLVYTSSFILVKAFPNPTLTLFYNEIYVFGNYILCFTMILIFFICASILRKKHDREHKVLVQFKDDQLLELNRIAKNQSTILNGVKNRSKHNLSLLSNILTLQRLQIENEDAKHHLLEANKRLKTFSFIQDKVYDYSDFTTIPLHEILSITIDRIILEEGISYPSIQIEKEIESVVVTSEKAVGISILCYELILNSIKHAYPSKNGTIYFKLNYIGKSIYITVEDNGIGFDKENVEENTGFTVLGNYAKQLDIKYEISQLNGTKITLVLMEN